MKKLRLRKWVIYSLIAINMLLMMFAVSEEANLLEQIISLIIFAFNSRLLINYTDLCEEV